MKDDDEKSYPIPEKFRASTDVKDEAAHTRLLANDVEQAELATRINSPFLKATPNDIQRSKALITIDALSRVKRTKEQNETFAECWGTVGRYDVALAVTKDRLAKKRYKTILNAIERPDGETCEHAASHKYVKARIFSEKHFREKSLVACNICGDVNATDTPPHVKAHQQSQQRHQGQGHKTIDDAKQYHLDNVK